MDALNLIALAKMAVIVIGVFMVPVITKKFASELGLPIGQMVMNRAALATAGLGFAATRVAAAVGGSVLSHSAPVLMSPVGQTINSVGRNFSQSSTVDQGVKKFAGQNLEKLGAYLEAAPTRLKAKKAGIEVPSLKDKVLKISSADPSVTGPIHQKEARYQKFANELQRFGSDRVAQTKNLESSSTGNQSISRNSPFRNLETQQASIKNSSELVLKNNRDFNPNHSSQRLERNAHPLASVENKNWLRSEVSKVSHRWSGSDRIKRLFEDRGTADQGGRR